MMRRSSFLALVALLILATSSSLVQAAPYASGITVTGGTTVNFILNQDADVLTYSLNGGSPIAMPTGLAKGPHSFTLGSASDTFTIVADKTEGGFTQPDGGTLVAAGNGLSQETNTGVGTLISSAGLLTKFNSPRGVSVSMNPNAPNFGTAYVSNSAAGATGGRTLTGDGLYALKADQTDAYGFGDAAQGTATFGAAATANTPYKVTVAGTGEVYVAGFGDAVSGVFRMPADLSSVTTVLAGTTGPTTLPVGQNHGSVTAVYVTGSTAGSDLNVYTLDEDMTTNQLTRANVTDPMGTDTNKLWQYNIGGGTLPHSAMPTAITPATPLIPGFSIITDLDRGADGKWYLTQNRAQPATVGAIFVTDPSGNVLFDSLTASRALYSTPDDFNDNDRVDAGDYVLWRKNSTLANESDNPGVVDATDYTNWRAKYGNLTGDIYSNIFGMAVSPDQKWMATLHNNNTIGITPLVNGIPDVANRLAIVTASTVVSARDIAFDAAGNIHFVSSGQGQYVVISPGGHTVATTSWNGSSYAFNITTIPGSGSLGGGTVPEPGTLALALTGLAALGFGRRCR